MSDRYSNLRTKTFLDFNPSKEAIEEIVGYSDKSIELFLESLNYTNPSDVIPSMTAGEYARMMSFVDFTDYTDDKELVSAIKREFGDEHESIFNE